MEPDFWEQFRLIVIERRTTISNLLAEIERTMRLLPDQCKGCDRMLTLSAAVRVFVLQTLISRSSSGARRARVRPRSPWSLPRGMHPSKAVRIGSAPEGSRTIVAAAHVVDQPYRLWPKQKPVHCRVWFAREGYIPGTLRYEILKRAKFRCELCGISADEKALEVDHIVPRNRGGTFKPPRRG